MDYVISSIIKIVLIVVGFLIVIIGIMWFAFLIMLGSNWIESK